MAKWTIIYDGGVISKDGHNYDGLDVSWLPSDVLAVQSADGVTCDIENGVQSTLWATTYQSDVATSGLSWWSNVSTTWQAAYDAEFPPDET